MVKEWGPHPYIPNSVPWVKQVMLGAVGAKGADELYGEMIPEGLLLKRPMVLPEPLMGELELKNHVESILRGNQTTDGYVSFLGGGCWRHYVPKVCEVIAGRSEFLTAYAGGSHSDLGRFQANFEFQSLICELVGMEVSGIPTYDWGSAAGNSVRMASRLTGRRSILVPRNVSPSRLGVVANFCASAQENAGIDIVPVGMDPGTGTVDLGDLESKLRGDVACIYFENPNYLGVIEDGGAEISALAHSVGAESVCGVDPISLGVLAPPSDYSVDIVCGEIQPLGIHMYAGGGSGGFIATRDEEKYVAENPLRLVSLAETVVPGEYGFGQALYERTSYMARENAKDWVGTTTALWGIVAAVYMSLLGPEGMREVGEAILQKSHYAAEALAELEGVQVPFRGFFKEFPVRFTAKAASEVNKELLRHEIFGGKDLSREFPDLGESALYCVTEAHTLEQIEALCSALREVLK